MVITMTTNLRDEDGNPIDLSALPLHKRMQERAAPAMTREERRVYDETHRLTANQLGRIMNGFNSLGFSPEDERPWYMPPERDWYGRQDRLGIMSRITGRNISSVHDLTRAEAGKLIGALERAVTIEDLYDQLPDGLQIGNEEEPSSLTGLLGSLIIQAMRSWLNQPPGIPSRQQNFCWDRVPLNGGDNDA